jgi:DNA-binding MarR family transcriptional regulator
VATALTPHSQALDDALQRLRSSEDRRANEFRTHTGLSAHDYSALRFVVNSAEATTPVGPKDIAREVCVTSASVTALIVRLERRGLLRRTFSTSDRRAVLLEATDDGRKVAATTTPADLRYQQVLAEIGPSDVEIIVRFLTTLSDAIDSLTHP